MYKWGAGGCSNVFRPAAVLAAVPITDPVIPAWHSSASSAKKWRASESSSLWWFSSFPQLPLLMKGWEVPGSSPQWVQPLLPSGPGSCLHRRAAHVACAEALLVAESCWFMCPKLHSCILTYTSPSGFLLCLDHGTLLVTRSSLCVFFASQMCEV